MDDISEEALVGRLVKDIREAGSEREVLIALAQGLTNLLGAAGTGVLMVNARKKRLEGRLGEPAAKWPHFSKIAIGLNESAAVSLAVNVKAPVMVPDVREDPRVKWWVATYYRCVAVLVVPIIAADKAIGCALVKEEDCPREFTGREIKNAERLAAAAAQVLEEQ